MPHSLLGPDPDALHPVPEHPRIMFVRNLPNLGRDLPNVEIGRYSYYDDPAGPDAFRANILYHYAFTGDRLVIGSFCALATRVRFMMNGANHRMTGTSSYPFQALSADWRGLFDGEFDDPVRGDTVIGNDVWIGWDALVLPGVRIGDGAIVGARAVVSRDVPPYAVVAGNPARVVRMRFDERTIARLSDLRWWDWDIARITEAIPALSAGRIEDLDALA